jgi:hypothetical protein
VTSTDSEQVVSKSWECVCLLNSLGEDSQSKHTTLVRSVPHGAVCILVPNATHMFLDNFG